MTAEPTPIDVRHLGRARVICCWRVGSTLVDPGPESCLATLLDALDGAPPRRLLLTHVHLDHAGAAGALVRRYPDLEVCVHERGATHLVDPSRLLSSARRLYGEDMDRLWGEVVPVPGARVRELRGGERLADGFEVAYTPGHASHHVSYLRDGMAFVGDVGGVRIPPSDLVVPPTPPPDIDLALWGESIERVAAWRPERLAMTHYGAREDVDRQLQAVARNLQEWAAVARDSDPEQFADRLRRAVGGHADPATAAAYAQAAPPDQLWLGLDRYWRRRAAPAAGAPAR